MFEALRPARGGFLRPFGCGWFIREFLLGKTPNGSPRIDPDIGAPQTDIHHYYKQSLFRAYAEDMVAVEEEERIRRGLRPLTVDEAEERVGVSSRAHSPKAYQDEVSQLHQVLLTPEAPWLRGGNR